MNNNHKNSASGAEDQWVDICLKAGASEFHFAKFRSYPIVRRVVDGYPQHVANQYFHRIKKAISDQKLFSRILNEWGSSDSICSPQIVKKFKSQGSEFLLTPATGRHLVHVLNYFDLLRDFKGNIKICEIGAGWGGECKLFMNLYPSFLESTVDGYDIYDLPSSQKLVGRYLKSFGIEPSFRDIFEIENETYSFVFSNGAFSEMRGNLIETYYKKVIENCSTGYFLSKFHTHSAPKEGGWSAEYFVDRLKKSGKKPLLIHNIDSLISLFDNAANVLVLFGFDNPLNKLRNIRYPKLSQYLDRVINKFVTVHG